MAIEIRHTGLTIRINCLQLTVKELNNFLTQLFLIEDGIAVGERISIEQNKAWPAFILLDGNGRIVLNDGYSFQTKEIVHTIEEWKEAIPKMIKVYNELYHP